jgi:hypothetical protein
MKLYAAIRILEEAAVNHAEYLEEHDEAFECNDNEDIMNLIGEALVVVRDFLMEMSL